MQDPSAVARHRQVNETSWRSTALTDAWRRWTPKQTVLLQQATNAILRASRVARGMQVLDLASGPGNPALQLAEAVGPQGCVTATDVIADMVASVEANAARAGVTNMRFRLADAHAIPFEAATFDVVTCRFGIMYFSNVAQALREVHRVCKPDGEIFIVNHFQSENRIIGGIEKALSGFSSTLGFHPDFKLHEVLPAGHNGEVSMSRVNLFWKIIRLRNGVKHRKV